MTIALGGLAFSGTGIGAGQVATFSVSDASAWNVGTGTLSMNVYDHASPSIGGRTISLPDSIAGYIGSLAGTSSSVTNGSGYRVNLKTTGGTASGPVTINDVGGVAPGSSANIGAAASLTGSQSIGAGAIDQMFNLNFADDSVLNGASSNLGSLSVTVTATSGGAQNFIDQRNDHLAAGLDSGLHRLPRRHRRRERH